jgi:DeoR/GlpR family transcriptional regulator of sugar metabolism
MSLRQIATDWDVSVMTARRDVDALADAGLVVKRRGGVGRAADQPRGELIGACDDSEVRRLVKSVRAFVNPGMTVGIPAGRHATAVAREIGQLPGLTFITNSLGAATALWAEFDSGNAEPEVILLPGTLGNHRALVGPLCTDAIQKLHVDVMFLSAGGFDRITASFSDRIETAEINRAFARASARTVALASSSRWGYRSHMSIGAMNRADAIITGVWPDKSDRDSIARTGASLQLV